MSSTKETDEGVWRPITVLKLETCRVGWSPYLKKSVFIDDTTPDGTIQALKRVREVDILTVYEQLKDRTMFIELKPVERDQFDEIYQRYLDVGGQIMYMRKKEGRITRSLFMLDEGTGKNDADVPEKRYLFDN